MEWGRPKSANAFIAWGARAIYTRRRIDILPDRQCWSSYDDATRSLRVAFCEGQYLSRWIIPWIEGERLALDSNEVITHTFQGCAGYEFQVEASPQGSHGYMYIVVNLVRLSPPAPTKDEAFGLQKRPRGKKWSGSMPVPKIGDRVRDKVAGTGVVEAYFWNDVWLGVQIRLDDLTWHAEQDAGQWHAGTALSFGTEIELIQEATCP